MAVWKEMMYMSDGAHSSKANAVDVACNLCRLASSRLDGIIDGYCDLIANQIETDECMVNLNEVENETISNLRESQSLLQEALQQTALIKDCFDSGKPQNCGGGSSWQGV